MKLFIILMILSVYFLCYAYDHFKSLLLTPIEYKNQIPQYDIQYTCNKIRSAISFFNLKCLNCMKS